MLRFRLRSLLIVACAALGVAGATTAVNYAAGGREQVLAQIQKLGSNVITVAARPSSAVAGRRRTGNIVTTLVADDYRALQREIDGVARHSAQAATTLRLKADGQSKLATVLGCEPDYFEIRHWDVDEGERFDVTHQRRAARVALLGATLARDLFGNQSPVGETLLINRIPFTILGVMRERGPGLDAVNEDQQVYVPLSAAMRRIMNVDYYSSILLQLDDYSRMDASSAQVTELLRERHRISATRPEDFTVLNQKTLVDTQMASARDLQFFVRWIGLSALLVAGLGVLAMAWIAVRDRTREIGTRRALGATARDVFVQFCYEAALLAAVGALTGLLLGRLLTAWIAARAGLPAVFDTGSAVLALAAALTINLVAGVWPAQRAARLDPVIALRHD